MNMDRTIVVERDSRALTTRVVEVLENQPELEAAAAAAIAAAAAAAQDAADAADDAADAQQAADDAAYYATLAIGTPSYQTRAEAEALTFPSSVQAIFANGQLYMRAAGGSDLVTAGGERWRQVRLNELFPSAFTASTDPAVLRAAIGLNGERDAIVGNTGVFTLDAAKFLPNSTVFGGNATADYTIDVSGAIVGQTYAIYNLASIGGRVTLDCGAEYGFMGDGITPNNLTTTTVTIEGGQVAYISRPNLTRVFIEVKGDYWINYGTASRYRRCTDGTFEFQHRLGATIAANTLSAVQSIPAGFTLANAIVLGCTTQPKVDGATAPASPCYVELMGTANGLAANEFRLRNPNAASFTHNSITHIVNVVRA
ncbi:hypothetical protein [Paracoccus sp. DMF]|uniref:hypothetical protein n=1 Tax=Paracoccus sp. DMF TaxID=400837 RepID=UPI0021E46263|nr:hypothetical protein [Paracoccus sp. DMF]MCV2448896.1 hypothetical protein [Paracoccus sp. DMF]